MITFCVIIVRKPYLNAYSDPNLTLFKSQCPERDKIAKIWMVPQKTAESSLVDKNIQFLLFICRPIDIFY